MNKRFYGWMLILGIVVVLAYLYKKGKVKLHGLPDISTTAGQPLLTDSPLAGAATPSSMSPANGAPIPGIVSSPSYTVPRAPTLPPSGRPNYYTP